MPIPIIAGILGLGGGVGANLATPKVQDILQNLDVSGDARYPTTPAGRVQRSNPYRGNGQQGFPSVALPRLPGFPPNRLRGR